MAGLEGARLGAYELGERVGSGGMAEVYRAKQLTAFGREVAVKVFRRGFSEDPFFRQRFLREAQAIAKLSHPHILPLIEFGEEREIVYLVMPYFSGGTLRTLLERVHGPLSPKDAIEILAQLCEAVQYAHEQGIVHRDIKPQNVLIQRGKHLLLADFGIARDTSDERLTATGAGVGTVEYMAPEQAMGRSDFRSDVYSLGIVLYQMLAGQVPFGGPTPVQVLMMQANEPPPPIRQVNPALPPTVDRLFERALAKDPNQRFQSPAELLQAVETVLRGPGANVETRAAPPPERPAPVRPAPPPAAPASSPANAANLLSSYDAPPAGPPRRPSPEAPASTKRGGSGAEQWTDAPAAPGARRSRDEYASNQQPVGWGGKPVTAPPARQYREDVRDAGTFAPEGPPRRQAPLAPASSGRSGGRPAGGRAATIAPGAPPKRGRKWLLGVAVFFVVLALGVSGIAFSKLLANNKVSPGATETGPKPKPSYAFLRNYQVYASLAGQDPQQLTMLPGVGQPSPLVSGFIVTDFLVSPLLFSPDGRYIACLLEVVNAPADGFFSGQLYLIDTMTKTVITPTEPGSTNFVTSYGGDNALAWKDAHTLLIAGDQKTSALLAYDTTSNTVSPAFMPHTPVGSVVVRGKSLFYSQLQPKPGSQNTFSLVLHRTDLSSSSDQVLFTLGEETMPDGPIPGPDGYAPFDISPDGSHVLWHGWQPGKVKTEGIWYGKVDGTEPVPLFSGADLEADAGYLQFQHAPLISPDGKKALLVGASTVYTTNLDGSNLKMHTKLTGEGAWLPDSSAITIAENVEAGSPSGKFQTFLCPLDNSNCSLFQDNATKLYWGYP